MRKNIKKIVSILMCLFLLSPAVWVNAAVPDVKTVSDLSQFAVYNSGTKLPTETDGIITTASGALKLLALEEAQTTMEKTFDNFYSADSYSVYGNTYTKANYSAVFEDGKLTTGNLQSKLRLKETSGVSDFDMGFTIQKVSENALYGGVAFRLQDDDFRTAPFGTRGYMLYLNSAKDSTDVKIVLRRYSTASSMTSSTATASSLLSDPMGAVKVQLTVSGTSLSVTVSDAANPESIYSTEFSLRPDTNEYYDHGSIAFVANGDHAFTDISLKAVTEEWTKVEKPVYGLMQENSYTVYGSSTADNYGVAFNGNVISTAGQSKIMLNHLTDIEDFTAEFSLTKTNGNSLYGGIAFHVQNCGFTAKPFGGPGYLLFATSAADSMDVKLILRNYLTDTSYEQTTVATIEGLLAAPADGIIFQVKVLGDMLTVSVADAVDPTRISQEYQASLQSENAKAGNYSGGSIAFVSNGTHEYSDISLSQLRKDRAYIQTENFTATADFTLPDSTTIQQGIMFYVQQAANRSPGLEGYSLNLIRTSSTADNTLTAQLVLYGTQEDGTQMVNLGAIKTQAIPDFLSSANGVGEKVRLTITVIRGMLTFSLMNLTTNKSSREYQVSLNDATNKDYIGEYRSGSIGCFSTVAGIGISGFSVMKLSDCKVSFGEYTGGTVQNGGTYSYQETVTVKAVADNNYYFAGWYDGDQLLSSEAEYSFTILEDTLLTPVFRLMPVRFAGISTDNRFAALTLDNIDGADSVGFHITVKTEAGERNSSCSTGYVKMQTGSAAPYIATAERVYYADVDNDGKIDSGDVEALRHYLLVEEDSVNAGVADVNGDGSFSIKDLVRMKKVLNSDAIELEEFQGDYMYPFALGDLISGTGKQYMELVPYVTVGSKCTYGTAQYLTFQDGAMTGSSMSANHTPFAEIRIACVGDSITAGIGATGWQSGDFSMAYPQQMERLLGEGFKVENFGKGSSYVYYEEGRTESLWYPNTAEYAASNESDPDIVIIKLGTNDARAVTDETKAQQWAQQFEDLITHYQNLESRPKVYVVSCLTMQLYNEDLENNLKTYILPLQKTVAESTGCVYLDAYTDLYDYFVSGEGFASDNIHPNDAGYAKMAEYIAGKLDFDIYY